MSDYLPYLMPRNATEVSDVDLGTAYPYNIMSIPTFRLSTYNLRSYSSFAYAGKAKGRCRRVKTNLREIMKCSDVVVVQETKLQAPDFYHDFQDEWVVFRNPYFTEDFYTDTEDDDFIGTDTESDYCSGASDDEDRWEEEKVSSKEAEIRFLREDGKLYSAKAGTDIFVRKSLACNFLLSHEIHKVGYVHSVTFTSRSQISTSHPYWSVPFAVMNCYISNESGSAMLDCLAAVEKAELGTDCVFAGGDWNLVTRAYDTTGDGHHQTYVDALMKALKAKGLTEVVHPSMTRISGSNPPQLARLDRWYVSLSEADQILAGPTVWLPPHSFEPGTGKGAPSDHFPVQLYFSKLGMRGSGGSFRIPKWLASSQELADAVEGVWDHSRSYPSPMIKLRAFDEVVVKQARRLLKQRKFSTASWADAVALATKLLLGLRRKTISLAEGVSGCAGNAHLCEFQSALTAEELTSELSEFITEGKVADDECDSVYTKRKAPFHPGVSSYVPQPNNRKGAHSRVRKGVSDDNAGGLDFLVDDVGDHIVDPDAKAKLLRDTWAPIWSGTEIDDEAIARYLETYPKRLLSSIDDITIEDVRRELIRPRTSCPGPNGVPFVAYSTLCHIAAPLLLDAIHHIMEGGDPGQDFNISDIFFLFKDGSHKPKRTRPISASNTNNRIIANVVRKKLEAPIHEILEKTQSGFVRTSSIEENVRFFNQKFYSSLYTRFSPEHPMPGVRYRYKSKGRTKWWTADDAPPVEGPPVDYHSVFIDFATAFPSTSRKFVIALLRHVGVPEKYVSLVHALFFNNCAVPAVGAKTDVRIPMVDGLKQGCPLSPLFFILCLDPLMYHLAQLPDVDERAFADDVALGSHEFDSFYPAFCAIDAWSAVSGCKVNVEKTKVVSTQPDFVVPRHRLPAQWASLQKADSYVYLGVLIGAAVDEEMVFGSAVAKLQARVARFVRSKDQFNLPDRVRIANVYLTPILSYLCRFFMMPLYTRGQVDQALRSWLLKGTETTLERLCAPSHAAGLKVPLRHPFLVNIASLLRNVPALMYPLAPVSPCTMLMTEHMRLAAEEYLAITGLPFLDVSSQAEHMRRLAHGWIKPMEKLATTLMNREVRHGSDREPGVVLGAMMKNAVLLPDSLKGGLRDHAFLLTHSMLYVEDRIKGKGRRQERKGCAFCGNPSETLEHVF